MLAETPQAEVEAYTARVVAECEENGHSVIVRNGSHRPGEVLTNAGADEVTAPKVNDGTNASSSMSAGACSRANPPGP